MTALARIETPLGRILKAEGRSQSWLAREVGAPRGQIWNYVHGLHWPGDDMQAKIARALQRTVAEVFPPDEQERSAA